MTTTPKILTRPAYWSDLNPGTKAYWRKVAAKFGAPSSTPGGRAWTAIVCTHRPNAREYRGANLIRRASTGGRWGKSSDIMRLDLPALLAAGYVLVD